MAEDKKAKEKPIEKMTAKELREAALGLPGIAGVHGMNKDELISAIKKAKGIKEEEGGKKDTSIRDLKQKIKVLKAKRVEALEAKESKQAVNLRRRISRLKKRARRAA
ncbi:MAG: Rho termination factor N-terminal domain-containing protein [Thermodesulfobacteriota bacterium]